MARKEKSNVEYFPHSVNHGKKMFCLRSKYKNDGYAVWFMLIEHLGKADNHYLDLKDDVQMIYLSSDLMVDEVVLLDIINMLVKLEVFDAELWNKERILFNEEFIESITDAYKKRNNECINRDSLILLLTSKGRWKTSKSNPKLNNPDLKDAKTPKEKKRKENDSKEEEKKYEIFFTEESLDLKFKEFINFRKELKKTMTKTSINKSIQLLEKHPTDIAIKMLEQSMLNGWQGIFEIKPQFNNGQSTSNNPKPSVTEVYRLNHEQNAESHREILLAQRRIREAKG